MKIERIRGQGGRIEGAERERERVEKNKRKKRWKERRKGPRKKEAGWISVEERRGRKRESPRVFGPCLPSSFVPELRLFSWPSFSRFVHPWAQGRARARESETE